MGTTARALVSEADTKQTIDSLNSAYAYHLTAMHWTHAVVNRLHGPALVLLGAELEKVASDNLSHQLVLRLLGAEIRREDEMEGILT